LLHISSIQDENKRLESSKFVVKDLVDIEIAKQTDHLATEFHSIEN